MEWLDAMEENNSFLAVDKNGDEWIFGVKPVRYEDIWTNEANPECAVQLPKGSIFKLTGENLTWNDSFVKLKVK